MLPNYNILYAEKCPAIFCKDYSVALIHIKSTIINITDNTATQYVLLL